MGIRAKDGDAKDCMRKAGAWAAPAKHSESDDRRDRAAHFLTDMETGKQPQRG